MIGAAVRTNWAKRRHALRATWRAIGSRIGASARTSAGWRPGTMALAARPEANVIAAIRPKAPTAATGPANGATAATTTAERAEHGVIVTRNAPSSRSRRVGRTRVPYIAGTLHPLAASRGIAARPGSPEVVKRRSVRTAALVR